MLRTPALLAVFSCSAALAGTLRVEGPTGVDLKELSVTCASLADLTLKDRTIDARYGVRFDRQNAEYVASMPLLIDEPIIAKDAGGAEYRVRVTAVVGRSRWIEITPLETVAPVPLDERSYRTQVVRVSGRPTKVPGVDVRLMPDGTYRVGTARGSWHKSEDGHWVVLDGYYARWGPGRMEADGLTITFTFERATQSLQVVLRLQDVTTLAFAP